MLNKKKTLTLIAILILVILSLVYILTGGGTSLNKVEVGGKTLKIKDNGSNPGFTSGEKYGIKSTIVGRYLDVTLDGVEVMKDLSDMKSPNKDDEEFLENGNLKDGYNIIRMDFTIKNKGDQEEELNLFSYLKGEDYSEWKVVATELNEENLIHSPYLYKIKPAEVKNISIGFVSSDEDFEKAKNSELSYQIQLPLREKVSDEEVNQVEYFYFNIDK